MTQPVVPDKTDRTTAHVAGARLILVGKATWTQRIEEALAEAGLMGPDLEVCGVDDFLCALGEAARRKPNVVIGQFGLLDGYARSIAEGFRKIDRRVLLLLTAPAPQQDQAAVALVDGFDDYLMEPVDSHILSRLVKARLTPRVEVRAQPTDVIEPQADVDETDETWEDAEVTDVADDVAPAPPEPEQEQRPSAPGETSAASGGGASGGRSKDRRPAWAGMPHPDDVVLPQHVLAERKPIVDFALPILEKRSRLRDVQYIKADGALPADRVVAPVVHDDETLGYLHAPAGTDEAALQAWGGWLAGWVAMEKRHADLWRQAHIDELTGVWNRRYFDLRLGELIEGAQQQRGRVTLMIFDIDDFKSFNDQFGHDAGDEILRETARLMQSVVRTHDIVARIGGDEFAVIFWDAEQRRKPDSQHPDDVRRAAERFQAAVKDARFAKLGVDAPGRLTISGGLAGYPWDARDASDLFRAADAAAMQSKRQGKNALTFGAGT